MRKIDKNRGSALAMTLVLLIFLTYFSVLITDMAYTNVKLSRSYNGDRRMYRGTDYVVNLLKKRLNAGIKEIQDEAKRQTEGDLQVSSRLRQLHTANEYLTEEGAMSYEDYDHEFNLLYATKYRALLNTSKYIGDAGGMLSAITIDELSRNESTKTDDEFYTLTLVKGENMYYKVTSGRYDSSDDTIEFIIYTKYEYTNEIREGSMQQQTTTRVKFRLSDGRDNFNLLNLRIVNKKNDMLPAFTNQMALLSEKNVVFLGDNKSIDILGDVTAFGCVPTVSGREKAGATWKEYGGVIFGYSPKLMAESIFGATWTSQKSGVLSSKVNAGEVTIDGDVSTLGYVNVARNWGDSINICGDTYARQFVMSEDSHRADVWLGYGYGNRNEEDDSIVQYDVIDETNATRSKNEILGKGNLYVTDDLQVDSSFAKLVVEGDYYGLSDMYVNVGGTGTEGDDMSDERRTSTLNINGDSVVELRNKVYVGGTSVLTKIRDTNNVAYVTGISGAKTSQISAEAYIKSAKNPNVYATRGDTVQEENAMSKGYTNKEETATDKTIQMINGYTGYEGNKFDFRARGLHFKEYFKEKVKDNFGLMGTMNFGNLRIKTDEDGKIQGWAEGVIIAAGILDFNNILGTEEVNAYFNKEFSESEAEVFLARELNPASQYSIIQKYQASQATFLETSNLGEGGKKIVQIGVDKHLTDYLNRSNSVLNDIKKVTNGVYLHKNEDLDAHLYYSKNANTVMTKDGARIKLVSNGVTKYLEDGYKKGIIFVEGDIFIEDGVEFEGVVIASGNITMSGEVKITRKADIMGEDIVNRLMKEDYYVKTFFGQNDYDVDKDDNLDVERVGQDYVKIVDYEVGVGYTE